MNWIVKGIGLCTAVLATTTASAAAVRVTLERDAADPSHWRLLRGGVPYDVHGVAGPWRLPLLASRGGNATRTWNVGPDTAKLLDEADANGISVLLCLGVPRGPKVDWSDAAFVDRQLDHIRQNVEAHRSHPAVLFWSIGNEAETNAPAYWAFVERAAQLVKSIDPDHPVMTIVAEIGGDKARRAKASCPSLDLLGVNAYAGVLSLGKRLTAQGWDRPYAITEFGPHGQWEVRKTDFGSPIEQTSGEKARFIARVYDEAINKDGRCVGSYLFLWAQKQESTHTWFGLFTEAGRPLEQTDVAEHAWTGRWPADRGPTVAGIDSPLAERRVKPGATVAAAARGAVDPQGGPLRYRWEVRADAGGKNLMGAAEARAATQAATIDNADAAACTVVVPPTAGRYRLYLEVQDAAGTCATANVPFFVESTP